MAPTVQGSSLLVSWEDGISMPRNPSAPLSRQVPLRCPGQGSCCGRMSDQRSFRSRVRLSPGARVGPYEVIAPLGAGGMGEVYRARDTRLARDVALKIVVGAMKLEPEWIQRFEQEAKLAGSLSHPNLVVVHDVGTEDGAPFLVTELLQGESLRERL